MFRSSAYYFRSCPFDYVKVYDGLTNESAVIGTYCGQQRNLVLYSSESSLFVAFITLQRTANTQNRGFKGIFEFSESFVKLGTYILQLSQIFLCSWRARAFAQLSSRCFFIA
jgi:CUB domain